MSASSWPRLSIQKGAAKGPTPNIKTQKRTRIIPPSIKTTTSTPVRKLLPRKSTKRRRTLMPRLTTGAIETRHG